MKFSLTITDATEAEIKQFLNGTSALVKPIAATAQPLHTTETATDQPIDDDGVNLNAPAVDADGLPHDTRIHSEGKAMTKDGSWRKRRGVSDAMVTTVEAELRSRGSAKMYTAPTPPDMMPQQYAQPMPQMQQYAQPMPQMQPAPQPMPQQQYDAPLDFGGFMQKLMPLMQMKMQDGVTALVDNAYLASVAQRLTQHTGKQFNAITDVQSDPASIPIAIQIMTADGRWLG